ncbi:MAG: hypothetical protein IKQ48_05720 [Paludibacteraceae bacterium]|nr:hypothetical protein [Paludibacteraceae bacterium]
MRKHQWFFTKAGAKLLLFFDIAKFFCIFLQNNANLVAIYLFWGDKKG